MDKIPNALYLDKIPNDLYLDKIINLSSKCEKS